MRPEHRTCLKTVAFSQCEAPAGLIAPWLVINPQYTQNHAEGAVAGYRGFLSSFKIRRMAAIVFQFRVVAGAP